MLHCYIVRCACGTIYLQTHDVRVMQIKEIELPIIVKGTNFITKGGVEWRNTSRSRCSMCMKDEKEAD